ncbi:MAG: class I SAM-dependent methyltransferase [Candidatus Thorarchaeota archaeon]
MTEWIIVLMLFVVVCVIGFLFFPRSNAPRQVGFAEGIDDSAVGAAFSRIQELPQFRMLRKRVVNRIIEPAVGKEIGEGSSLLDLGCGTGHLLMVLHNTIVSGRLNPLELHGLDLGSESVRLCRENLANSGIYNVDVREGDGAYMPYDDASFDVVVSSFSLHHWAEPILVLDEIYRVLRKDGLLVLFDMRRDCRRFWHRLLGFAARVVAPKALRNVREPLGSLLASYTTVELMDLLSKSSWRESESKVESFLFAQMLSTRK